MDDEFARWKWNFKEDANETRRVSFKRSKVNTILHTLPARSLARVTRESERNKEKREKKKEEEEEKKTTEGAAKMRQRELQKLHGFERASFALSNRDSGLVNLH